ncbi:fungal-specific transcription factor domain-containing protein [Aspergillus spinulosporus]
MAGPRGSFVNHARIIAPGTVSAARSRTQNMRKRKRIPRRLRAPGISRYHRMPPKMAGNPKRRNSARRKVALACGSCREKKIRCDGSKPICGPCTRRSYRINQCVYNTDNARSASRDEYFQTLHRRIRELEDACQRAGVSVETLSDRQAQCEPLSESHMQGEMSGEGDILSSTAPHASEETTAHNPASTDFRVELPRGQRVLSTHSQSTNGQSASAAEATTERRPKTGAYESPLFDDGEGQITGMGQITAPDGEGRRQSPRFQFYGSSSTASLMRFAWQSISSRTAKDLSAKCATSTLQDTSTEFRFDDFSLPPRTLADHLVSCFFDHVYTLYPFFHRPAFEAAYRNLWRAEDEPRIPLTDSRIGLGSAPESGPRSIVFHSALNLIFALGCQFADIPPAEVELIANSFFLRAKRFIGLDLLDINTLGVVQTLLITAIFLQSSPYPSRCWHSVGVACRVALGLGLHESGILATLTPLESDIRRRTWHGCVMMDVTLSMTYGRPTMTTHLAPLPPPDGLTMSHSDETWDPSLMAFYTEAIKLYDILDRILSDVYYASRSRSRRDQSQSSTKSQGVLDTVLEIERQLISFEANLPPFLRWNSGIWTTDSSPQRNQAIAQQRNVLHARYVHLHLLLHRPIFTQLYSDKVRERESCGDIDSQESLAAQSFTTRSTLYSSLASNSATACVTAAIDLACLVSKTYNTNATDAWWYNGFYVSTAAIVLLMSFSFPSTFDPAIMYRAREAWQEATSVLESMAIVSQSAKNTLQFLQAAYRQAVPGDVHPPDNEVAGAAASLHPDGMAQAHDLFEQPDHDLMQAPFFNWEEYTAHMGQRVEDLGFLTRLDFP